MITLGDLLVLPRAAAFASAAVAALVVSTYTAADARAQAAAAREPDRWAPTWADEFNGAGVDNSKWDNVYRMFNANNEQQAYLPWMADIAQDGPDGVLRITSTNEGWWDEGTQQWRPYRSARLESWIDQAYGRFEVRGRVPTTKGIWPAIWLLPRYTPWPTGGEIDIMEHGGSNPYRVSSAYHWGDQPGNNAYLWSTYEDGRRFGDHYVTYSVEWTPTEMRFFVDDTMHWLVTDQQAPISSTPMHVIINTAVGGNFDGSPDGSTVWPQTFDIDYVRVFQRKPPSNLNGTVNNGAFEQGDAGWNLAGNAFLHTHDTTASPAFIGLEGEGGTALKLFGDFGGEQSRVTQSLIAPPDDGGPLVLSAYSRVNSDDSIAGTDNFVGMFFIAYDVWDQVVGGDYRLMADGSTPEDVWTQHTLSYWPGDNVAYVEVGFAFDQPSNAPGAVWVDGVTLVPEPTTAVLAATLFALAAHRRRTRRRR